MAPASALWRSGPRTGFETVRNMFPGVAIAVIVAFAAQFTSTHLGVPAMLTALLFGIALNFLSADTKAKPGIAFSSRTLLRVSVALLGARISFEMLIGLGAKGIALVVAAVILTILSGLLIARLLGRGWRLGLVTGGSVAICGASAAMAIAAVLPQNRNSERNLVFTVMSVTILSTIAMVLYPMLARSLGFDDLTAGLFFGGSIHDVAQVVGAGFSYSEAAGETATLVKLIRVAMLAPVVLTLVVVFRMAMPDAVESSKRPPLLPAFVVGFLIFATLNSFGVIPQPMVTAAGTLSRWGLVTAIAAVGMKTPLGDLREIGRTAIILITAETLFIAAFVLGGLMISA